MSCWSTSTNLSRTFWSSNQNCIHMATIIPEHNDKEINKYLGLLSDLCVQKNSFLPIFCLPPEILVNIFPLPHMTMRAMTIQHFMSLIGLMSHMSVFTSTISLWTVLHFRPTCHIHKSVLSSTLDLHSHIHQLQSTFLQVTVRTLQTSLHILLHSVPCTFDASVLDSLLSFHCSCVWLQT